MLENRGGSTLLIAAVTAGGLLFTGVAGPAAGDHELYGDCAEVLEHMILLPPDARENSSLVYVIYHPGFPLEERWFEKPPMVYGESNGAPGLQRHDRFCTDRLANGTWYTQETADTRLF